MTNKQAVKERAALVGVLVVGLALLGGLTPGVADPEVAGLDPAGPARVLDGRLADWAGTPTRLGGTSVYSVGEFVHQDHLYDDLGAETRARSKQHGTVGAPRGDYRYPTDASRYVDNAADLLELRFGADATDLWVLARLNTLKQPDSTVVALAFDTDGDARTGGGPWPHDAGLAAPGADVVLTLWGTGATLTTMPGGAPEPFGDVAVDVGDNAIEARVPLAALGHPEAFGVWAATGLWDNGAGAWMPVPSAAPTATQPGGGSATVAARAFNVAFRDGETGSFMEEVQAAALAAGDISSFRAEVDISLLQHGADLPYEIEPGRFYAAIVDQGFTIPPHHEGLSYGGVPGRFAGAGGAALAQSFSFYGRHQPYGLYLPSTYDGNTPHPAALVLHGLGGSHSTYNSQPGFLADMGEGNGTEEEPPMVLVTPLARGSSFYADWGEADTLAVLDDVIARFPVDEDRLYLTGYSMGGYGVYRLASLHPDRFAAAASWAGYTGEFTGAYLTDPQALVDDPTGLYDAAADVVRPLLGETGLGGGRRGKAIIGNPVDTMENLRHLPLVALIGTNDEIVPTTGQYAAVRRMAELGYRSRVDLYPGYEHFAFALVDDWKEVRTWLGNRTRTSNPRRIDYKFSDGWTAPGLAAELGLVHDGAWWLRGLTMREPTDDGLTLASATATSLGIAEDAVTAAAATGSSPSPTPHVHHTVSWSSGQPLPVANRLELELAGVGRASVDTTAAKLSTCGLAVGVVTDGPVTLELRGPVASSAKVTGIAGVTASGSKKAGVLTVTIPGAADGVLRVICPPFGPLP